MNIFVKHNVLQEMNFTGLPYQSTFEPLCLLNNVIFDAKDNNKPLFIYLQDMSKAYDKVNLHMLQKAMYYLKLPSTFITFISNLFTNRYNQVFTAYSTTNAYKVLVRIRDGNGHGHDRS